MSFWSLVTEARKSVVRIGIGNAEGCQNLGFQGSPWSRASSSVEVIVAQNVQESMDHEVGEMVVEGDALLRGLALQRSRGRG